MTVAGLRKKAHRVRSGLGKVCPPSTTLLWDNDRSIKLSSCYAADSKNNVSRVNAAAKIRDQITREIRKCPSCYR